MQYTTPRMPAGGQKLSAAWGRNLIDAVRAGLPVAAPGMLLRRGMYGTSMMPMVEAKSGGFTIGGSTTTLEPFTVRWYSKATEESPNAGEWQIYMPLGCATMSSRFGTDGWQDIPYVSLDNSATDANGDDIYGWYKIPDPSTSDATRTEKDGVVTLTWRVYVRFAAWPRMEVSTNTTGDKIKTPYLNKTFALISVSTSEGEQTHGVDQWYSGEEKFSRVDSDRLAITYKTEDDVMAKDAVWKPYLTNMSFIFGRMDLSLAGDVDVSGDEQVVLWIQHPGESFDVDIVSEAEMEENDDDNSYISIYDMKDDCIVEDNRYRVTAVPWYNY